MRRAGAGPRWRRHLVLILHARIHRGGAARPGIVAGGLSRTLSRASRRQIAGTTQRTQDRSERRSQHLTPRLLRERNAEAEIARLQPQERRVRWQAVIDANESAQNLGTLRGRLVRPVKRVEEALGQSRWLAGAAYSIADIDAFAMLDPLPELAPEVVNERATRRVSGFLLRMQDRPAVRTALGRSRSGSPRTAFVPGVESSRWG
jgi:hypothetical protein